MKYGKHASKALQTALAKGSHTKDGKKDIVLHILQKHWDKAVPFDPTCCAVAVCAKERFDDCRILRNIVLVRKGKTWSRYMAGGAVKVIAALIDKGNKKKVALPAAGLSLVFHAPKGSKTLIERRSRAQVLKDKLRKGRGGVRKTTRKTDGISLQDIRSGTGVWV